jgi:hypothetical protein
VPLETVEDEVEAELELETVVATRSGHGAS